MKAPALLLGALVLTGACRKKHEASKDQAVHETGSGAVGSGSAVATPPDAPPPVTTIKEGFATPESVLYDEGGDRYLVSNINGGATDTDDNGYIATVSPDGVVSKWLDGASADVKLDAPKGLALSGDVLWVADISVVRRFDAKSGKQLPDVPLTGSTFLNDVAPDGAGGVYVTDSGLDGKFQPKGTDAIYRIGKDGVPKTLAKSKDLGNPNGIAMGSGGSVWVVGFGSGEVYEIDAAGTKKPGSKPPKGQLDGIVLLDGGEMMVTSWEGKAVYKGNGASWKELVTNVESPADIGFDAKRHRLLLPLFMTNTVELHAL